VRERVTKGECDACFHIFPHARLCTHKPPLVRCKKKSLSDVRQGCKKRLGLGLFDKHVREKKATPKHRASVYLDPIVHRGSSGNP
jgi:hypothetical protein